MSNESKCDCQHCGGHIAFPSEAAGQTVECPHCKIETLLFLPPAETSQIVNCPCQHCFGAIEFDSSELVEENSIVQCPHCGLETKLFVPQIAATSNPASSEDELEAEAEAKKEAELKMLKEPVASLENSMTISSKQDTLELQGDSITIRKRGWANALASGMNGDRTIQISSLTAVQMKPAGMITLGYILFSYAGSKPFMGVAFGKPRKTPTHFFLPTI